MMAFLVEKKLNHKLNWDNVPTIMQMTLPNVVLYIQLLYFALNYIEICSWWSSWQ